MRAGALGKRRVGAVSPTSRPTSRRLRTGRPGTGQPRKASALLPARCPQQMGWAVYGTGQAGPYTSSRTLLDRATHATDVGLAPQACSQTMSPWVPKMWGSRMLECELACPRENLPEPPVFES
eukprot:scaffold800_cov111-Isochrysis_galbana.AAC.4